jgi:4-amino-4-deoxy-L-arabinose transferase-like glycosyltransferase
MNEEIMLDTLINKQQWVKLGLFVLSLACGIFGVLSNRLEFALIAVILATFSFWDSAYRLPREDNLEPAIRTKVNPNQLIIAAGLIFYAVFAMVGATYIANSFPFSPLSVILWIISIGLLLSAGIVHDHLQPSAWIRRIKNLDIVSRRNLIIEVLLVIIITGVALALRAIDLEHYPPMMHGDEGEMGLEALRVLGKGDPLALFESGWFGFANLFFFLQAGSMALFGQNLFGLRIISALIGTGCVPLLYLIGRRYWGKLAGFTGAWLIAISHFNIHYSRLALNNIETSFFMILFIWLFLVSFFPRRPKNHQEAVTGEELSNSSLQKRIYWTPLIATGLVGGVSQYMYLGSRLIPLVALLVCLYLLIQKRIGYVHIALIVLSATVVFAPIGFHYLKFSEQFFGRMNTVSIFNPENVAHNYGPGVTWSKNAGEILYQQLVKNLNFFLQSGDTSAFYLQDIPAFDLVTALLFWLGLGAVLGRVLSIPEFTIITWFGLGIIFAGVLTNDSPNGPRLLTVTPTVYLVAGIFVQRLMDEFTHFLRRIPEVHVSAGWLSAPLLISLMVATLAVNMNDYFNLYAKSEINILPISLAREIAIDAITDHVYLLGENDIYVGHGTIRFLAGEGKAVDLHNIDDFPQPLEDGKGITVLATGSHLEELKLIQSRYPNGAWSESFDSLDRLIFLKYRIPPLP